MITEVRKGKITLSNLRRKERKVTVTPTGGEPFDCNINSLKKFAYLRLYNNKKITCFFSEGSGIKNGNLYGGYFSDCFYVTLPKNYNLPKFQIWYYTETSNDDMSWGKWQYTVDNKGYTVRVNDKTKMFLRSKSEFIKMLMILGTE